MAEEEIDTSLTTLNLSLSQQSEEDAALKGELEMLIERLKVSYWPLDLIVIDSEITDFTLLSH